jgi:solute carrier family 25 (mitochondrial iron transporter), member 28/37
MSSSGSADTKTVKSASIYNKEAKIHYGYNLVFASISALVARFITHPLDTHKTLRQYASSSMNVTPRTVLQYYNGLGVSLFFSVPATTVYLTVYDQTKLQFKDRDSLSCHGWSAVAAEGTSAAFWTPMEVMKNKLQVHPSKSSLSLARSILATEGSRGFYRGYILSQMVFVPYTITYFVTYEYLKKEWKRKRELGVAGYILCSVVSATLAGAITNPLDVSVANADCENKGAG